MHREEKNGPNFNLRTYLNARLTCLRAADEIISAVEDGMTEKDGHELVRNIFSKYGVSKYWHPTKFRIATDTSKSFRDLSEPNLKCSYGDIAFIDVGPIIENHEADYGRSFIVGGGAISGDKVCVDLIRASEEVFKLTAAHWKTFKKSGLELYEFANLHSKERGFILNPKMSGHRLGDFPHKVHSSQNLFGYSQTPSENLWVLEIHLLDEKSGRGAFFEDILL